MKLPEKITSIYPPTIVNLPTGRYAVASSTWIPITAKVKMEDLLKRWVKWEPSIKEKAPNQQSDWSWQILNSKGNGYYTVSFDKRGWACTCPGYSFRRSCKHIEQAKKKLP